MDVTGRMPSILETGGRSGGAAGTEQLRTAPLVSERDKTLVRT